MAKFILFILIIFLVILILGISFLSRFVRLFTKQPGGSSQNRNRYQSNSNPNTEADNRKVFSKDEGEYVDYEEIKETKSH